jgi:hypothetical protein
MPHVCLYGFASRHAGMVQCPFTRIELAGWRLLACIAFLTLAFSPRIICLIVVLLVFMAPTTGLWAEFDDRIMLRSANLSFQLLLVLSCTFVEIIPKLLYYTPLCL